MRARHWLTLVVALSASLAVTGAEAAAKKKSGGATVRGCTYALSEFCLGLVTPRGQRYALYNPSPWMPLKIGARVTGQPVAGTCGATGIQVSSWKADKTVTCK